MKVIFLDIDGVLNNMKEPHLDINPKLVSIFNTIVEKTQAEIVLSSTWRLFNTLNDMDDLLKKNGYKYNKIIGRTPFFRKEIRGREIESYLEDNPQISKYLILDDNDDFLDHQKHYHVQTNIQNGLTDSLIERCVHILNGV